MRAPIPYDYLPPVPAFALTSESMADGGRVADEQVYDRGNVSPQLSWSGYPAQTLSFAVTCFDPDAPTGSGWWHWLVFNLPADVTSLAAGAALPAGAVTSRNDYAEYGYGGPNPPHGPAHRYVFAVHALDTARLDLDPDAPAAQVGGSIRRHTIARAVLTAEFGY
ncbi:YbhB/YbcL family Raf kinase inhibitor-like protein [Longispora albida]|uniref:YbhB/YbcL family Raf kinase inhibitor-like protein n=1 Tax=Longispora albida TaxID=203523 RepID=UPI00036D5968|nr:YbhB/YbcL family Raf kinase inhibitor-like protein [Longispora albida]